MALNNDTSSYDGYEQTVERLLAEVNTQLKNLKNSGVIPDADCEEYASALTDWGKHWLFHHERNQKAVTRIRQLINSE